MEQDSSELKEIGNFEASSKNNESQNQAQTSESISSVLVKKADPSQDVKPKRVRKPEMVRYQPPSSRTSNKPSEKSESPVTLTILHFFTIK